MRKVKSSQAPVSINSCAESIILESSENCIKKKLT